MFRVPSWLLVLDISTNRSTPVVFLTDGAVLIELEVAIGQVNRLRDWSAQDLETTIHSDRKSKTRFEIRSTSSSHSIHRHSNFGAFAGALISPPERIAFTT